jgi:hypothetical protein
MCPSEMVDFADVLLESQLGGGGGDRMEMSAVLLTPLFILLLFLALWGGSAGWAVSDAQRRGQSGGLLFLLLWVCGPFAAVIWYFVRPRTTLIERSFDDYDNEGDGLEAASRLEQLGDWDAAVLLYERVAEKWPENKHYVDECVKVIREKQSRT